MSAPQANWGRGLPGFTGGADDLLLLDDDTLNSLVMTNAAARSGLTASPSGQAAGSGGGAASPSGPTAKRLRTGEDSSSLREFLVQLRTDGLDDGDDRGTGSEEDREEDDGRGDDRGGKGKRSGASQAARNKACREKKRRERLNEGFVELAKLIDPGKQVKNDKASLVEDAVRVITQLRAENNQLKQLNKFLEEKVTDSEKQRSQLQVQQMMMQQMMGQTGMMAGPSGAAFPNMGAVPGMPMGMPVASGMPGAPMPNMLQSMPSGSNLAGTSAGVKPDYAAMMANPGGMPVGPHSWIPPSMLDTSQDHKLRPPAA